MPIQRRFHRLQYISLDRLSHEICLYIFFFQTSLINQSTILKTGDKKMVAVILMSATFPFTTAHTTDEHAYEAVHPFSLEKYYKLRKSCIEKLLCGYTISACTQKPTEAQGGPLRDFLFIFHFFIFVFKFLLFTSPFCFSAEIFVFRFYFSVFAFHVLIFTSPFCFSVEISVFIFHFPIFVFNLVFAFHLAILLFGWDFRFFFYFSVFAFNVLIFTSLFCLSVFIFTFPFSFHFLIFTDLFRFTFPSFDGLLLP